MKMGSWVRVLLAATLLVVLTGLSGCGDFWQDPYTSSSTSFSLANSVNITLTAGSAGTGTSTITVTPGSSFSGTVDITCSVSAPSGATDPVTCSLDPASVTVSDSTAATSTLTATSEAGTTAGGYDVTVTGVSGSVAETTTVCVVVGTGSCASSTSSNAFYILNADSISNGVPTNGSIAGYKISSGALAAISGSSYSVSGGTAVAIAPGGGFLFVASSNGLTPYTIDTSTGALTQGSPLPTSDTDAEAIQIVQPTSTTGWLLDLSAATGDLTAIPITSAGLEDTRSSTAVLTPALSVSGGSLQPGGLAVSANGTMIAVPLGTNGFQVVQFAPGNTTSSPFVNLFGPYTLSNVGGTSSALSAAFDLKNAYLYVGETNAIGSSSATYPGGLLAYTYSVSGSNLTLTPLGSSPYASGGLSPLAILPEASGDYLYVANGVGEGSQGNVTEFGVASSGLTVGGSIAAGSQPAGLAEDSSDSYIFEVGYDGSPYFDAYTLSSGALASQVTSTTPATSIAIVAAPAQ